MILLYMLLQLFFVSGDKVAYLYKKVTSGSQQCNTRQAADNTAALAAVGVTSQPSINIPELELSRSSWCWASVKWYRQLPPSLQAEKKLAKFKRGFKSWVS